MGGRALPTECPHGRVVDPGDFGESSEGCDACGIPAFTWDDDGNIIEEPRTQTSKGTGHDRDARLRHPRPQLRLPVSAAAPTPKQGEPMTEWFDAGSSTTRLPSAAGAKLAARARAAAAALTAAAARIPAAEARARDDASPLGAASYDHPIVGGSRSELWCWHHQRPVTACQHDDLLCTGEPVPVGDPTGEAAIRSHDDHAHQARAALAKVEAGVADLLALLDRATAAPAPPDAKARRDTALANDPDACEHCAAHGHYEPTYRDTNPGGNLARKYRLGSFCWRWVVDTGSLPTAKELTDHHVNGRRVMRPA